MRAIGGRLTEAEAEAVLGGLIPGAGVRGELVEITTGSGIVQEWARRWAVTFFARCLAHGALMAVAAADVVRITEVSGRVWLVDLRTVREARASELAGDGLAGATVVRCPAGDPRDSAGSGARASRPGGRLAAHWRATGED